MRKDTQEKLAFWYEEIKDFEQLNITEAQELCILMINSSGEEKAKYRERIILGTLHVIYNFISKSGFTSIKATYFDIEDIISISNEVWINILDSGKILKVSKYRELLYSTFYTKIIEQLLGVNMRSYEHGSVVGDKFGKILKQFLIDVSNGVEIDRKRCEYYLENVGKKLSRYIMSPSHNYLTYEIYMILSNLIKILDVEEAGEISITRLNWLKQLLLDLCIFNNNVETIKLKDVCSKVDKKIIEEEFRDSIFKTDILTEREKYIIKERFYNTKTLTEVGKIIGVTSERISQIENKAIRQLRKQKVRRQISSYYEN